MRNGVPGSRGSHQDRIRPARRRRGFYWGRRLCAASLWSEVIVRFAGRPRGRTVDSNPSRVTVFVTQALVPSGVPRTTLRRISSRSAAGIGVLSFLAQFRPRLPDYDRALAKWAGPTSSLRLTSASRQRAGPAWPAGLLST